MNLVKKLFKYYLWMVAIFFTGRVILFGLYFDRFKDSGVDYWLSFLYGLRMDTIIASLFLVLPMFALTLTPKIYKNGINLFLRYYFLVIFSLILYIENANLPFMAQYDVRPNYLFVEYLSYPKEVFSMLIEDYLPQLSVAFLIILAFIYLFLKFSKKAWIEILEINYLKRAMLFIPLFIILFVGIRSSFGHRPANISDALYSNSRIVNEITKNSIHSIISAIYSNQKYGTDIDKYGKMEIKEAIGRVEKRLNIESLDDNFPFFRVEKTHFKVPQPKNLVIFLQESMGAQFVEVIGGESGITPNLNRLSKEGILFQNLYSNGTRSVKGISGMVSGIFSVPGEGVVKRDKSQQDFFTIASLLKPHGYHTMFIYGGESRFDNMKSWFSGNGFDEIIDQSSFENPEFVGTWGVSDGDLVEKAHQHFSSLYKKNQKFASVIFSTSNHPPFDFPQDKIELIQGVKAKSVKNAVKYADFTIGQLIKKAKKANYYKDTIFVIVADHNVRVFGDDYLPVDKFRIPALILGDVKPLDVQKLTTHPDILATALDLIGLDLKYPILGKSIFDDKKNDISLMQFYKTYALRVKNQVAIIRQGKKTLTFEYKDKKLKKISHNSELEKDLLAFVIVLNYLYEKRLFTSKNQN